MYPLWQTQAHNGLLAVASNTLDGNGESWCHVDTLLCPHSINDINATLGHELSQLAAPFLCSRLLSEARVHLSRLHSQLYPKHQSFSSSKLTKTDHRRASASSSTGHTLDQLALLSACPRVWVKFDSKSASASASDKIANVVAKLDSSLSSCRHQCKHSAHLLVFMLVAPIWPTHSTVGLRFCLAIIA